MLKKTISYTDYNGVERTEDFYFHLSKAEITELELSTDGGYAEMINKIINAKDIPSIAKIFKDLIFRAYGEKSDDGKRFVKSKEISTAFSQTEAYSNLYMELATSADEASKFVNGIIPSDMVVEKPPVETTQGTVYTAETAKTNAVAAEISRK